MPGLVVFALLLQFSQTQQIFRELEACLDPTQTECTACSPGSYLNNKACFKCPTNCIECTSDTVCTSCSPGAFLNQTACSSCPTNCKTCQSASNCTSCNSSFYHSSDSCLSCPSKCPTCLSQSNCSSCAKGFYLSNASCLDCLSGCTECSALNSCSSCAAAYYFKDNSCVKCSSSCLACNETTCLKCAEGTYFKEGSCFDCASKPLKAIIKGPTEYSTICKELFLDARLSVFDKNQPIVFSWTVEQVDLAGVLISNNSYSGQVISPNVSNVSSTLIINLTLSICQQKSFTQLKTLVKTEPGVLLGPGFGNSVKVASTEQVLIKAGIADLCGLTGDVKWAWLGQINATGESLMISGQPVGEYNQSLRATVSDSVTFFNFSLVVAAPPLILVLSRSSGLASWKEDFLVEGSEGSGQIITKYEWTCFNSTSKQQCLNQTGDALNPGNQKTLLVANSLLVKNGNLTISLKLQTATQEKSLSIEVMFGDFQDVSIIQTTETINSNKDFYILTTGQSTGKVLWKSSIELPFPNLLSLWVPAESLKKSSEYNFKLFIDQVEYGSVFVTTNSIPYCESSFALPTASDFSSGLTIFSPSCASPENYPLSFSLNYSTPSYLNLTLKTLLPVGSPSYLTLAVCDSLNSCLEQSSLVTVLFEKLSDSEINQKYSEFTKTTDLVPLTIISLALSTEIPADLFKTMLSDLETYFNTFINPEIAVLASLSALTSSFQPDSLVTSNYEKIISMIENVNSTHFNSKLQVFYTVQVHSNLARLKSPAKLEVSIQVFLESVKKLTANYAPGQKFEVSNPDFSFFKATRQGSEFSSFVYQVSGRKISFPPNLPFDPSSLMNFYCTLYKNKGNYSDLIEISFTNSGEIVNNSLILEPESNVKLSKLPKPISVSLKYRKQVYNKWACAYLQDGEWLSSGCLFSKNDSNYVNFTTNHTSIFSVFDTSEVRLPPVQYIESSSGCGKNFNGIWILVVVVFLYIIFLPIVWYFDRADFRELNRNNNYDNIKKCDSDPSIASPSFSEEMPSNNNLSSDYAIQYKPKPQKLRKHTCKVLIEGHLLFGLPVFRTEFTRVLRMTTLAVVLIFELLLEGLLMMGFEDTDSGSSEDAKKYFEDYKDKYFGYTIFALTISLLVQVSLIILFSLKGKMRRFGVAAGVALVFVILLGSIAGIIIMAVKFCPNWSGYWGISFLFGTIVEVVIVQTTIMISRWGLLKCFD